jgi:hypothetical protein
MSFSIRTLIRGDSYLDITVKYVDDKSRNDNGFCMLGRNVIFLYFSPFRCYLKGLSCKESSSRLKVLF